MTLRDLVLTMDGDEYLRIRRVGETESVECSPEEIINDYDENVQNATVSHIWVSYSLYSAIMIEIE